MSWSVFASGFASKYVSSSRWKTELFGETAAKSVAEDRSFMSSGEPKIWFAVFPSTPSAASVHSISRGARMGGVR